MSLPFENILFSDLLNSNDYPNGFCLSMLENYFGSNLDCNWIEKIKIDATSKNLWIWNNYSCRTSIASTIYEHTNRLSSLADNWIGWSIIWKLPLLPHIKVFSPEACPWRNSYHSLFISF